MIPEIATWPSPVFVGQRDRGLTRGHRLYAVFRWMFVYYMSAAVKLQISEVVCCFIHFCCELLHNILYTCLLNEQQELGQTKLRSWTSSSQEAILQLQWFCLCWYCSLEKDTSTSRDWRESLRGKVACRLNWRIYFRFQNSPPKVVKVFETTPQTKKTWFWNKNTNIQKYCVALKLATSSIKFGWSHVVPKKTSP